MQLCSQGRECGGRPVATACEHALGRCYLCWIKGWGGVVLWRGKRSHHLGRSCVPLRSWKMYRAPGEWGERQQVSGGSSGLWKLWGTGECKSILVVAVNMKVGGLDYNFKEWLWGKMTWNEKRSHLARKATSESKIVNHFQISDALAHLKILSFTSGLLMLN